MGAVALLLDFSGRRKRTRLDRRKWEIFSALFARGFHEKFASSVEALSGAF